MTPSRPSLYTPELFESILDRLAIGTPLAEICRDEGMPAARTVRHWCQHDEALALAYGDARDDGYDALAAECKRIADTPMPGVEERWEWVVVDADSPTVEVRPKHEWRQVEKRVADCLQHRKLQIETRLKLLAKWDPRRYGDRIAHEHSGALSLEQLVSRAVTPASAAP